MSQRFCADFRGDALTLFFRLFCLRPAPFYAYINAKDHFIVSTSMERFLFSDGKIIDQISKKIPYRDDPFVGGFMGYISYEFKNVIEPHLPQRAKDDLGLSDLFFIFPSKVAVFDKKKLN